MIIPESYHNGFNNTKEVADDIQGMICIQRLSIMKWYNFVDKVENTIGSVKGTTKSTVDVCKNTTEESAGSTYTKTIKKSFAE